MSERICLICGKQFTAKYNHYKPLTCGSPECKSILVKQIHAKKRFEKEMEEKKAEKEKKKVVSISEINKKARKKGMTYGQYMAQQQAKLVKVERKDERKKH